MGLNVTQITGHLSLTSSETEGGLAVTEARGLKKAAPPGEIEEPSFKPADKEPFGTTKPHASLQIAIGSMDKARYTSPLTFPIQTTYTLRVATRPLCEMNEHSNPPCCIWSNKKDQAGFPWGPPAGNWIQPPCSNLSYGHYCLGLYQARLKLSPINQQLQH